MHKCEKFFKELRRGRRERNALTGFSRRAGRFALEWKPAEGKFFLGQVDGPKTQTRWSPLGVMWGMMTKTGLSCLGHLGLLGSS